LLWLGRRFAFAQERGFVFALALVVLAFVLVLARALLDGAPAKISDVATSVASAAIGMPPLFLPDVCAPQNRVHASLQKQEIAV
jgi:hypothetical protein